METASLLYQAARFLPPSFPQLCLVAHVSVIFSVRFQKSTPRKIILVRSKPQQHLGVVKINLLPPCRKMASVLNMKEGEHYVRVCMGEKGFGPLVDDLARENYTALSAAAAGNSRDHPKDGTYFCDIGVSQVAVSSERSDRGIQFSRTTLRSDLAIMVHAPLQVNHLECSFIILFLVCKQGRTP